MYGTVTKAKPAEKFAIPMARVRSVGGYWNVVNVGMTAFATPVALFTARKSENNGEVSTVRTLCGFIQKQQCFKAEVTTVRHASNCNRIPPFLHHCGPCARNRLVI